MSPAFRPFEDRFWDKVDQSGECWMWTGFINRGGYGVIAKRENNVRRNQTAHRASYEIANGPIPAGLHIDHICFNHACVKPDHLRTATNKQNQENRQGAWATSKSGVRGVSWNEKSLAWRAQVTHNRKTHRLGPFSNIADAEAAVIAKRLELYTHNEVDRRRAA